MRKANHKTVIMSAFRKELNSGENFDRHCDLLVDIKQSYRCGAVQGRYEGNEELSIVVQLDHSSDVIILSALANHYQQDCIMVVNEDNSCDLVYADGRTEGIGKMIMVEPSVAMQGDYTHDFRNDIYYKVI